ncbi:MAG TPA: hypothetical protein VGH63_04160 [Polyangia bacterium]
MERNVAELLLVVLLDRARLARLRVRVPASDDDDDGGGGAAPAAVPVDAVLSFIDAVQDRDDD